MQTRGLVPRIRELLALLDIRSPQPQKGSVTFLTQARWCCLRTTTAALCTALTACAVEGEGTEVSSSEQALRAPQAFLCLNIPLPHVNDSYAPPAPELEAIDSSRCGRVTLTWRHSYDTHSLIEAYRIYRGGQLIAETQGTPEFLRASLREHRVSGLSNSASYVFGVSAVDIYGNESEVAEFSSVTTPASGSAVCTDRTPPTTPTGLSLTPVPGFCRSVQISSNGNSVDGQSGLQEYIVYRDGVKVARTNSGSIGSERFGLVPGETYSYWMTAVDRAGNESSRSNIVGYSVPDCSTTVAGGNIDTLVLAINLPGYVAPAMTTSDIALTVFGRESFDQVTQVRAEHSATVKESADKSRAPASSERLLDNPGVDLIPTESETRPFTKAELVRKVELVAKPDIAGLNPPNMKSFFKEVSYGRINMRDAGVHGWIQLSGPISKYCAEFSNSGDGVNCDVSRILSDARALAASNFGFDPDTHVERTIAIINGQAQNRAGSGVLYLSDMRLGTAIHEFAHTFGVEHAASWRGRNFTALVGAQEALLVDAYDIPFGSNLLLEYGDPYNRMGAPGIYHFSTFQKELLGALTPNQILHAQGNGTFVLDQVEFPSSGKKELRIPVEPGGDTNKAPFIIAEYRSGRGYNATPNGDGEVFRGIQFRLVPARFSGVASDTFYMGAVTEESPVFEDWHRNVRYTLVDRNEQTATLHICGISPPPVNSL